MKVCFDMMPNNHSGLSNYRYYSYYKSVLNVYGSYQGCREGLGGGSVGGGVAGQIQYNECGSLTHIVLGDLGACPQGILKFYML